MNSFGIIYKITNKINGKIYIGQTIYKLESRWNRHVRESNGDHSRALCAAIRKYGKESFKVETVETVNVCDLDIREIFWIKKLNSLSYGSGHGYNMTVGGDGIRGRIQTEEEKKKRAISMTGLKRSRESKDNMSVKMMGRKITWKEKISKGMTKRLAKNPKHLAQVIKQAKAASIKNMKPVEALLNGLWVEFDSRKSLAEKIKVSASNISTALSNLKFGKITLVKGIQVRPKLSDNKEKVKEI